MSHPITDQEALRRAHDSSPFNVVFAEARIERCLSKKDLAEKTGFTNSFITSYEEYAKNPTAGTLFRYARALGLKFTIDSNGITITNEGDVVVLERWVPEERNDR